MKIKSVISVFAIVTIGISIISLSGCGRQPKQEPNNQVFLTNAQEENAKIKTDVAKEQLINLEIKIPAQFKARNITMDTIYAPFDGKVIKIFVEPGAVLKVGQPVAQIKSDDLGQIQLEFIEKILAIDADIAQAKAQYDLANQTYKREKTLFMEKISSRAEYEVALADMKKAQAQINSLNTKKNSLIRIYQQRLNVFGSAGSINTMLRTKQISPIVTLTANKNGILLERKINESEFVQKDRDLFSLADLSTIWLVGYAFEKDAPLIKVGQKVWAMVGDKNDRKVDGVLSFESPILDNETKTLEVRADIQNKDHYLKPNMYAEMYVNIGKNNVLAVKNSAIEKYGDYSFVFVKTAPNTYEERKVALGKNDNTYTEIKSGIKDGEEVVIEGSFQVLGEFIKLHEAN